MAKKLMEKINKILGENAKLDEQGDEFDVPSDLGGDDLGNDLGGEDEFADEEESLSSWVASVEADLDPAVVEEIKSFVQFKIEQGAPEDDLGGDDLEDFGGNDEIDIEVEESVDEACKDEDKDADKDEDK